MRTHGLFIGIDEYPEESGFSPLRFAAADAANLRQALLEAPAGLDLSSARLVTSTTVGKRLQRNDLLAEITKLRSNVHLHDTIIFYFAGHGFFTEHGGARGSSYIAPPDIHQDNDRPIADTAISVETVRSMLVEARASHIVIILDACREDTSLVSRGDERSGFGTDLEQESKEPLPPITAVWEILSACGPESRALEDSTLRGGLWTTALCEAVASLTEELRKNTAASPISVRQIFETAKERLPNLVHGRVKQDPRLYSNVKGSSIPLLQSRPSLTTHASITPWSDLRGEIDLAMRRIRRQIGEFESPSKTLLKRSRRIEEHFGCKRLYFKLESVQNTGSFKYRGATNAVEKLFEDEQRTALVASSAGNHGLGLAVAAKHREMDCHIFMPENTPLTKSTAVRRYTEHVYLRGANYDESQRIAMEFAKNRGFQFVHPFNDPYVVAGQGTIGLELIEQWEEVRKASPSIAAEPDFVIIPCGGGGLLAGILTALSKQWQRTRIIAVEPEAVPSLEAALNNNGHPTEVQGKPTIADGIAVRTVGSETLNIIRNVVKLEDVWRVSENAIATAMLSLMEDARVIAEGAGATPLAAMAAKEVQQPGLFKDKTVICVISGGNVDISAVSTVVQRGMVDQQRLTHFVFTVPDRPGALADITRALADASANIVDLNHTRYSDRVGLNYADVHVVVETQDARHASEIYDRLRADMRFEVKREHI